MTLFLLDEGVDSGPIIGQIRYPIDPHETARTLYAKATDAHRELMRVVWPQILRGQVDSRPQDHQLATYWPQRRPMDGEIRIEMGVQQIDRLVRAVTRPYPGAFLRSGPEVIRIWEGTTVLPKVPAYRVEAADGDYWATEWQGEAPQDQPR